MKISLVVITLNQCLKLNRLLSSSLDYVDEIIVVDGGSTDDTEKICKIHQAKMYVKKWENNFSIQKKIALDKANGDWILSLDDDEVLEYSLWAHLYDIMKTDKDGNKCYSIIRKNYYRFESFKHSEDLLNFPDYQMRFFRRGMQFNNEIIHAGIDTSGYENIKIPLEFGGIIHEKTWEDQKKADILYRNIEKSYNK